MARSSEEILKFYLSEEAKDIFGYTQDTLTEFMSPDELLTAEKILKGNERLVYEHTPRGRDSVTVSKELCNYMEFAWIKAQRHFHISAIRSLRRFVAYLYLMGDDELLKFTIDEKNYPIYGVPILKRISEKYGCPIPEGDWVTRMANGKPCRDGCDEGCDLLYKP